MIQTLFSEVEVVNTEFYQRLVNLSVDLANEFGTVAVGVNVAIVPASSIAENKHSLVAEDYQHAVQVRDLRTYLQRRWKAVRLNVISECRRVVEQGFINSSSINFRFSPLVQTRVRELISRCSDN